MVMLKLMITAEVENVSTIQPMGGCDDPSFCYYFKFLQIRCENCGEISAKETCVILEDLVPNKSRGQVNLIQKCKGCGREGTILMVPGANANKRSTKCKPLTGEDCEAGNYAPLMLFDCRGLEPIEYSFGANWKVESTSGTVYENVDLSEGDWAEYDEKGEVPVSIGNLRFRFEVVKD